MVPKIPALEFQVKEPVFGRARSLNIPVDTGFAGYLLLPRDLYDELATLERAREEFGVYIALSGPIVLRRAEVWFPFAPGNSMPSLKRLSMGWGSSLSEGG